MAGPRKTDKSKADEDYARWPTVESKGIDAGYEKVRSRAQEELKETMAGPGKANGGPSQRPIGRPASRKR